MGGEMVLGLKILIVPPEDYSLDPVWVPTLGGLQPPIIPFLEDPKSFSVLWSTSTHMAYTPIDANPHR